MAVVAGAKYVIEQFQFASRPAALIDALSRIQHSRQAAQLVHQREQIILMTAATKNFKVVGKPSIAGTPVASPTGGSAGTPTVTAPPPNPGSAEAIAAKMLPKFGFSTKTQYPCLYNIWENESGWRWNAYNASGAYGIPQALPGSKMASAGADWQTNPATQIAWGLGYIKGRYGTPCGAWSFWEANRWY